MTIIVGLGNPGEKFNNTPHNIGFAVVDKFVKENNFPDFKLNKKSNALISEGIIGEEKIILTKPQTFMNNSGSAVKSLIKNLKLKIKNYIVVVHDDVDLPLGQIKIAKNRGSAGHKGIESIIKTIGNENFIRIRVGVMPATGKPKETEKFVLRKMEIPEQVITKAVNAIKILLADGPEKVMNEINK